MNLHQLQPTKLRIILLASLALTIAVAVVIFYFATTSLREVATSVSHKVADAEASRNSLENLKKIQKFLAEQGATIDRVNAIVAESQSYQYQDQIIIDLNTYAAQAGIVVTSINFSSAAETAAAPTDAGDATAEAETSTSGGSVKSTFVSATIQSPVDYESLLRFVKSIEQNLTKMQISNISLSKGAENNDVTTDALNIEVYVR